MVAPLDEPGHDLVARGRVGHDPGDRGQREDGER
jgi:hypothetical protein